MITFMCLFWFLFFSFFCFVVGGEEKKIYRLELIL